VLSTSYERLARLSVFIDEARRGELNSVHDRHHHTFERLFHHLEYDQDGGLYTVLCALSRLFRSLTDSGALLGADLVEAIGRIEVPRPPNHAQRHTRDYAVASSTLRVARRLAGDMLRLAERYRR